MVVVVMVVSVVIIVSAALVIVFVRRGKQHQKNQHLVKTPHAGMVVALFLAARA